MYVKILKVHFLRVDTFMDYIVDSLTPAEEYFFSKGLESSKDPMKFQWTKRNLSQYTFLWFYKIYYLCPKI
jgi:hypothetical protein